MRKELTEKLLKDYKELYIDHTSPLSESLMSFGFEVGDGWFNIIDSLSRCITFYVKSKIEHEILMRKIVRFERSFGGLRKGWYCWDWWKQIPPKYKEYIRLRKSLDMDAMQVRAIQVKEKFGGLRFYVDGADNEVYGMITMAEAMSYVTCEQCGNPGSLHHRGGWLKTVCSKCAVKLEYIKGSDPYDK